MKISENLLRTVSWTKEEQSNVQVVCAFVQALMIEHRTEDVKRDFASSNYVQHNRNIPDGMEGIANYIRDFAKQFPEFTYDVKRIIADSEYVVFHSHATLYKKDRGNDKKGLNITDTWRLEGGKIVEHWDSIQAIDVPMRLYSLFAGGSIKNSNGVF